MPWSIILWCKFSNKSIGLILNLCCIPMDTIYHIVCIAQIAVVNHQFIANFLDALFLHKVPILSCFKNVKFKLNSLFNSHLQSLSNILFIYKK